MIGATSGIGHAMSEKLVQSGSEVIIVGRRKDRLDAFVSKHGEEQVGAVAFDINDTAGLPQFVKTLTTKYPELGCIFSNAGIQRIYNFSKPYEVDIAGFHAEVAVNFSSPVNITHAFFPFLMSQQSNVPTRIIEEVQGLPFVYLLR
jgi:short-subunit dehydrogenase involved in D-alanine esterification of teichoic acids